MLFEELVRFYGYFGLVREERAELPDHLGVELEVMHFLCWLEDAAVGRGEDVAGLRRAQADFLARHLGRLARGLAQERTRLIEGTLDLWSEPGKGSRTTIAIPIETLRVRKSEEADRGAQAHI